MSDFNDWNKYFNQVFNGAWDCYSSAEDEPYKQWIKIGARWAVDFQNDLISDLNFETEAKLAYKSKYENLYKEILDLRAHVYKLEAQRHWANEKLIERKKERKS